MGIEIKETSRALVGGFEILSIDALKCHIRGGWIERDGVPVNIPRVRSLLLPDDELNIYIYVNMTSDEIQFSTIGWINGCKRLYKLTTDGGVIVESSIEDNRAGWRFSHHSCYATHDQWLQDSIINSDVDWTDFDVSSVITIPNWAAGVELEVHVKETGAIVGDASYVAFRKPDEAAQSQWKLVQPQISGRLFTRTVPVEFGSDGKTIQYKIDVETSIILKIGLAGWVPGRQ